MRVMCASLQVPGPKLANMVQNGKTPVLPASVLKEIGYTAVIYPLCLFSSALKVPAGPISASLGASLACLSCL